MDSKYEYNIKLSYYGFILYLKQLKFAPMNLIKVTCCKLLVNIYEIIFHSDES